MLKELEIKNKVLELDTKTNSVYNFNTHLPYPSIQSIYDNTGINLIELEGSTHQAESKVKLFTNKAYKILVYGKVERTNRQLEYLIATNEDFRREFLEYVISLIGDVFISGNNSILMGSEAETSESLRHRARFYHSGKLDAPSYILPYFEYRLGY